MGGGLLCHMHLFFHMDSQHFRQIVICGITHTCLVSPVLAFSFSYPLSALSSCFICPWISSHVLWLFLLFVCFCWVKVSLLCLLPSRYPLPALSMFQCSIQEGKEYAHYYAAYCWGVAVWETLSPFFWFSQGDEEVLLFTLWQGSTSSPSPSSGELNIALYHWVCIDCCWELRLLCCG